jgi:hypothetical protein
VAAGWVEKGGISEVARDPVATSWGSKISVRLHFFKKHVTSVKGNLSLMQTNTTTRPFPETHIQQWCADDNKRPQAIGNEMF